MTVHHTGIIVMDIEKNIRLYEKFGYVHRFDVVVTNNKIIFLKSLDETQTIELIEPLNEKSTVYNYKSGYHHICYDVSNIPDFLFNFKTLEIGKIFTKKIIAPAINNREFVFAFLNNGVFVEFLLSR